MTPDMNDLEFEYVAMSAAKLAKVEKIVAMAKGRPTFVDGEKDWEVIWELFTLWYEEYPEQFDDFQRSIAELRRSLKDNNGFFKEKGSDLWQIQLETPQTLHTMIKAIYPDQKWDKAFTRELAKRVPILKVADKI